VALLEGGKPPPATPLAHSILLRESLGLAPARWRGK